jgi:hypothetical protein
MLRPNKHRTLKAKLIPDRSTDVIDLAVSGGARLRTPSSTLINN